MTSLQFRGDVISTEAKERATGGHLSESSKRRALDRFLRMNTRAGRERPWRRGSHDAIKAWVAQRQGRPGTEHEDHVGVLRFDFPGYGGDNLQEITWDEWFKPFDERRLVFLYQEHKADGSESNFFRLDNPSCEDG